MKEIHVYRHTVHVPINGTMTGEVSVSILEHEIDMFVGVHKRSQIGQTLGHAHIHYLSIATYRLDVIAVNFILSSSN